MVPIGASRALSVKLNIWLDGDLLYSHRHEINQLVNVDISVSNALFLRIHALIFLRIHALIVAYMIRSPSKQHPLCFLSSG